MALFFCVFLLISTNLCAQVGFGVNKTNKSSVAHFRARYKGTLKDLNDSKIKTTGGDAEESLLVQNKTNITF